MTAFETMRQNRQMTALEAEARRFAVDCTGATAVEYALLLGGIAVVVAAGTP